MPRGGDKSAGLAPPAARAVRVKLLRGEMSSIPVTFDPEAALERWQKLNFTRQRAHVEAVERAKKPETRQRRIAAVVERCTPWS